MNTTRTPAATLPIPTCPIGTDTPASVLAALGLRFDRITRTTHHLPSR